MNHKEKSLEQITQLHGWLVLNVGIDQPTVINRKTVADKLLVKVNLLSRALLMLERNSFLSKAAGGHASVYTRTADLELVTPETIYQMVLDYDAECRKRETEKRLATQPTLFEEPVHVDPIDCRYGIIAPEGIRWYDLPETAALRAKEAAIDLGLQSIDIIQKIGRVEVQPTVSFY